MATSQATSTLSLAALGAPRISPPLSTHAAPSGGRLSPTDGPVAKKSDAPSSPALPTTSFPAIAAVSAWNMLSSQHISTRLPLPCTWPTQPTANNGSASSGSSSSSTLRSSASSNDSTTENSPLKFSGDSLEANPDSQSSGGARSAIGEEMGAGSEKSSNPISALALVAARTAGKALKSEENKNTDRMNGESSPELAKQAHRNVEKEMEAKTVESSEGRFQTSDNDEKMPNTRNKRKYYEMTTSVKPPSGYNDWEEHPTTKYFAIPGAVPPSSTSTSSTPLYAYPSHLANQAMFMAPSKQLHALQPQQNYFSSQTPFDLAQDFASPSATHGFHINSPAHLYANIPIALPPDLASVVSNSDAQNLAFVAAAVAANASLNPLMSSLTPTSTNTVYSASSSTHPSAQIANSASLMYQYLQQQQQQFQQQQQMLSVASAANEYQAAVLAAAQTQACIQAQIQAQAHAMAIVYAQAQVQAQAQLLKSSESKQEAANRKSPVSSYSSAPMFDWTSYQDSMVQQYTESPKLQSSTLPRDQEDRRKLKTSIPSGTSGPRQETVMSIKPMTKTPKIEKEERESSDKSIRGEQRHHHGLRSRSAAAAAAVAASEEENEEEKMKEEEKREDSEIEEVDEEGGEDRPERNVSVFPRDVPILSSGVLVSETHPKVDAFRYANSEWARYNWHVRSGGRYIMTEKAHRRYFACDVATCRAVLYEDTPTEFRNGEMAQSGELRMQLQRGHNHSVPVFAKPCADLLARATFLVKSMPPEQARDLIIIEAANGIGIPSLQLIVACSRDQTLPHQILKRTSRWGLHYRRRSPVPRNYNSPPYSDDAEDSRSSSPASPRR